MFSFCSRLFCAHKNCQKALLVLFFPHKGEKSNYKKTKLVFPKVIIMFCCFYCRFLISLHLCWTMVFIFCFQPLPKRKEEAADRKIITFKTAMTSKDAVLQELWLQIIVSVHHIKTTRTERILCSIWEEITWFSCWNWKVAHFRMSRGFAATFLLLRM